MPVTRELPERQSVDTSAPAGAEGAAPGLPAEWTATRLRELVDRVYELLRRELVLERERGA